MKTKEPFSAWVARQMDERGWHDPQLAREAKLPEKTIGRVRTGASTDVRMRTFIAIVAAFGEEPFEVYQRVTFENASGDSATARERSYDISGMRRRSDDLVGAAVSG